MRCSKYGTKGIPQQILREWASPFEMQFGNAGCSVATDLSLGSDATPVDWPVSRTNRIIAARRT
jgi:hypothetical protein